MRGRASIQRSDFVAEASPRELLQRLNLMPEGAEVAVLFGGSRAGRARAVNASWSLDRSGLLIFSANELA